MSSNYDIVVTVAVVANILSVIGFILSTKYIIESDRYNFMIFLTFIHYAFTSVGTRALAHTKVFNYATADGDVSTALSGRIVMVSDILKSYAYMYVFLTI